MKLEKSVSIGNVLVNYIGKASELEFYIDQPYETVFIVKDEHVLGLLTFDLGMSQGMGYISSVCVRELK